MRCLDLAARRKRIPARWVGREKCRSRVTVWCVRGTNTTASFRLFTVTFTITIRRNSNVINYTWSIINIDFSSLSHALLQVSTWFANARRRLKKENKVQWSTTPGNSDRKPRDDDDIDDDVSDYNDVSDYDLHATDECRQMALAVSQPSKDVASRLGK